jgi:hypothetical protein
MQRTSGLGDFVEVIEEVVWFLPDDFSRMLMTAHLPPIGRAAEGCHYHVA